MFGGNAFPSTGDKHPTLTMTALAARGCDHIRAQAKGKETVKVTHQEIVFNDFGRVRDIIIGPDGLFYVALNLPGVRTFDNTLGTVVRLVPIASSPPVPEKNRPDR